MNETEVKVWIAVDDVSLENNTIKVSNGDESLTLTISRNCGGEIEIFLAIKSQSIKTSLTKECRLSPNRLDNFKIKEEEYGDGKKGLSVSMSFTHKLELQFDFEFEFNFVYQMVRDYFEEAERYMKEVCRSDYVMFPQIPVEEIEQLIDMKEWEGIDRDNMKKAKKYLLWVLNMYRRRKLPKETKTWWSRSTIKDFLDYIRATGFVNEDWYPPEWIRRR